MYIRSTIAQLHPSCRFFVLLGLFIFFLGVASLAQVISILPFADINEVQNLINGSDFTNSNIINGLKLAQALSAIIAFILPALLFAYLAHPNPPEGRELESLIYSDSNKNRKINTLSYLKLNEGFLFTLGAAVFFLVIAIMPAINWMGELNNHLSLPDFLSGLENWMKTSEESAKKLTEAFLKMDDLLDLFINIIVIALLAAVGEELLFRGAMQNVLMEWMKNKHLAVWVTAILFSALHMQFYGFFPRMLLGVVLGYLYVWSNSLWLSILFHFLNNGLAVLFSYLIAKGTISENAETIGAGDTPFYLVIFSIITALGILFYIQRTSHSKITV